jgi:hypothetical protein
VDFCKILEEIMSIKYEHQRETIADVIKKVTDNATYVIPDLQRPYVWNPSQVIMLIDSLFRGWPFGSLLLWEVKHDHFSANEGIPPRGFWDVVDRTECRTGRENSMQGAPATYQMVLDGQQRVQSLILALGRDQSGFKLSDFDWHLDLKGRRVRKNEHWSKASLCVSLEKFKNELSGKQDLVRKIDISKILEWVVMNPNSDSSPGRPGKYDHPLSNAVDKPGQFIRLSRLWELVQDPLSTEEYFNLLLPLLKEHGVKEEYSPLTKSLADFMQLVEKTKTMSFVHALQIKSFVPTAQWNKDDYAEAIVNIFTRLNSAGRTLTREEITMAWLKTGWQKELVNHKSASKCFDELLEALRDRGLQLQASDVDEIVRLISFIWAIEHNSGNLLKESDLLLGTVVRPMAAKVAEIWTQLKTKVETCADLIRSRDIHEHSGSFNAVIVYMTWYWVVFERFDAIKKNVTEPVRDSIQKQLDELAKHFLDRWVFGSMWANVWGDNATRNFQTFAKDLHGGFEKLKGADASNLIDIADQIIKGLMNRVLARATEQINTVQVGNRRGVHEYFPFLWVWHRLDHDRWEHSDIQLREGRKRTRKLEVDHTVADAYWKGLVAQQITVKLASFSGTEEEKSQVGPDGFASKDEAYSFINRLGNCSLLEKSFNISKSDKPMRDFLEKVHEFKNKITQMADWEKALSLAPEMTAPDKAAFADIKSAIETRDILIRKDLVEFIGGQKYRVD